MDFRGLLKHATQDELRENYELSREVLREIISEEENYTPAFRLHAIEMLMRLDAMYTGGFDPGGSQPNYEE